MKSMQGSADELHDAVYRLGRELRDALHLVQIVEWLNDRLTRKP